MEESGVDISALSEKADALAGQGETPMFFAADGALLGLISVADPVKETSAAAILLCASRASGWCCSRETAAPPQSTSAPLWAWTR